MDLRLNRTFALSFSILLHSWFGFVMLPLIIAWWHARNHEVVSLHTANGSRLWLDMLLLINGSVLTLSLSHSYWLSCFHVGSLYVIVKWFMSLVLRLWTLVSLESWFVVLDSLIVIGSWFLVSWLWLWDLELWFYESRSSVMVSAHDSVFNGSWVLVNGLLVLALDPWISEYR